MARATNSLLLEVRFRFVLCRLGATPYSPFPALCTFHDNPHRE